MGAEPDPTGGGDPVGWLVLGHRAGGFVPLTAMVDDTVPDTAALLAAHVGAVTARKGGVPPRLVRLQPRTVLP